MSKHWHNQAVLLQWRRKFLFKLKFILFFSHIIPFCDLRSNDENHPASDSIDGNEKTFWMTTGLFPQTIVLTFPHTIDIRSIKLTAFGSKLIYVFVFNLLEAINHLKK